MTETFDEIADRLYSLPPATFVAARDEAAARARGAGDRGRARAIAGLRRPTVAAWMVNLLVRNRPDLLDDLLNLGAALRSAQHDLHGPRLRELTTRRRAVLAALAGQVTDLAVAAGMVRVGLPVAEVEATLTAALSDAYVASEVRSGRLLRAVHYDGFGEVPRPHLEVITGGKAATEPVPEEPPLLGRPARDRHLPIDPGQEQRRLAEAQDALAAAERDLLDAEQEARTRMVALADIETRLTDLHRQRTAARTGLSDANSRREMAERSVTTARRAVATAQRRQAAQLAAQDAPRVPLRATRPEPTMPPAE